MNNSDNQQLKLAYEFVQHTDCHVFLTGRAGTGKTTFLHELKKNTHKRLVVLAPTGVAAINAGGVTIHSFFQLPFGPQVPAAAAGLDLTGREEAAPPALRPQRFHREKINIIKSLDLLVIDEISMVRADLLDAIDAVLRRYRNPDRPFGGLQLLMIGDLQQLAPVVREEDWNILQDYYDSPYFFSSYALKKTNYVSLELKQIYRQQDQAFIELLNRLRDQRLDEETLRALNSRYLPGFSPAPEEGWITLTTHNHQAREINQAKILALPGRARTFKARIEGEFPEISYPTDPELTLKVGAQVMFVKNDLSPLKQYYNGKIGTITAIEEGLVQVKCPGDDFAVDVGPVAWKNCRYSLEEETKEIRETTLGTFTQHPLKPAWAITIHKSQGLTFDRAIIDAGAAFAPGQVYVALSRCRTQDGVVLSRPISPRALKSDYKINQFTRRIEENPPGEKELKARKNEYHAGLVRELFDFRPLSQHLGYLRKLLRENVSRLDEGLIPLFDRMDQVLKTEIAEVAQKFLRQVQRLLAENPELEQNDLLRERIGKACAYFTPRIEREILAMLPADAMETDNKTLRKSLREALSRLRFEAGVKAACLRAGAEGFQIVPYLQARARASIADHPEIKTPNASRIPVSPKQPEFYVLLKSWRDQKARAENLPGHRLLPRRTLTEIAERLPATRQDLLAIHGMGEKKFQRYGAEILKMTLDFRRENNLETPAEEPGPGKAGRREGRNSRKTIFRAFPGGEEHHGDCRGKKSGRLHRGRPSGAFCGNRETPA